MVNWQLMVMGIVEYSIVSERAVDNAELDGRVGVLATAYKTGAGDACTVLEGGGGSCDGSGVRRCYYLHRH